MPRGHPSQCESIQNQFFQASSNSRKVSNERFPDTCGTKPTTSQPCPHPPPPHHHHHHHYPLLLVVVVIVIVIIIVIIIIVIVIVVVVIVIVVVVVVDSINVIII